MRPSKSPLKIDSNTGEVAEWLKAHAWKACNGLSRSRVRIPPSPPYSQSKALVPRGLFLLSLTAH